MSPPIRPERNKTAVTFIKKPVFSCPCSVSRPGSPNQAKYSRRPSAEHSLVGSGQGGRLQHELATFHRDTIVCHILFSTRDDSPHWIDLPKRKGDETFELPVPATSSVEADRKIRKALVNADYTDFPEMAIATDSVDSELVEQPRRWDINRRP